MSDFLDVTRAIVWRNVRNSVTRPIFTLLPMIIPLIFFATFAGGFGALARGPGFGSEFSGNYTTFQFVFVVMQGCSFQGMFSGFLIARDFESGFAKRLMLAAPNRAGILGGYVVSAFLRAVVGAAILFGVGYLAGVRPHGNALEVLLLAVLGLSLTVIFGLWAAGISLRFRTIQAGPLIQMPVFVVLFLSPVFVPLALLTGWLHTAARVNPFSVFMEQGRNLILGADPKILLAFGIALGITALGVLWGVRGLRSAERAG